MAHYNLTTSAPAYIHHVSFKEGLIQNGVHLINFT
jgi:hypothetical protein